MAIHRSQDIRLETLSDDLESQGKLLRRVSLYRNLVTLSQQNIGLPRSQSMRSTASAWKENTLTSITQFTRRQTHSPKGTKTPPDPVPTLSDEARKAFIYAVTKRHASSVDEPPIATSCKWFTEYLEIKIKQSWITILRPILKDIGHDNEADTPNDASIAIAFRFLAAVVFFSKRGEEVALSDITGDLYNEDLLQDVDSDSYHATKLVFTALGWLSMLYYPSLTSSLEHLIIEPGFETAIHGPNNRERPGRGRSKALRNLKRPLKDTWDRPLWQVLGEFGDILPQRLPSEINDSFHRSTATDERRIELNQLRFYTLSKLASVEIEWVDTLSLHLEFDSSTRKLKVFRFPSACLILGCDAETTILCQLLLDAAASRSTTTEISRTSPTEASKFYKEVILSYRLIFGQDKRSYKAFNKLTRKAEKKSSKGASQGVQDELLPLLCGQHWESEKARQIYDLIDAEDPDTHFTPLSKFPFLGRRLLVVQEYVRSREPNTFRMLWHDRRNTTLWWTFWAVIIIGTVTLLIGLISVILQILQIIIAQKQLDQGQRGGSGELR